jgi:hypothetical protein
MLCYLPDTVKRVPSRDNRGLTLNRDIPKGKESLNLCVMRSRPLVLTSESARHPFRQRLPRHVLRVVEPAPAARERPPVSDDNDWKLFVLSFGAFFTAFYSFIF